MRKCVWFALLCLAWGMTAFGQGGGEVKKLVAQLKSKNVDDRREAAKVLEQLGPEARSAAQALITAVSKDTDATVRKNAILALSKVGLDPKDPKDAKDIKETRAALINALRDKGGSAYRNEITDTLAKLGKDSVPGLVSFLSGKNKAAEEDTRAACVTALGNIGPAGGKESASVLRSTLNDTSEKLKVRQAAAAALGKLGAEAVPAIGALINVSKEGTDDTLRTNAITSLAMLVPVVKEDAARDILKALSAAMKDKKKPAIAKKAVEALLKMGQAAVPPLIDIIVAKDTPDDFRLEAAKHLAKLEPEGAKVVPDLVKLLQIKNETIQKIAAESLLHIGIDAKGSVSDIIKAMGDSPDPVKEILGKLLGKIGKAALPELVKLLKSEDDATRAAAADAIGNIGADAAGAEKEINLLLKDKSPSVRAKAVDVLEKIGKSPVPGLVEQLKDLDPTVRAGAVELLGALGPKAKAALPSLRPLLKDPVKEVRVQVVIAMKEMGPEAKGALPDFIAALKDADTDVRRQAAAAIAPFGPEAKEAVPALVANLKDKDEGVRKDMVDALSKVGEAAVAPLIQALKDPSELCRQSAAEALGAIGPKAKEAVLPLASVLQDADVNVRKFAALALRDIGASAKEAAVELTLALLNDKDKDVREFAGSALIQINPDPAIALPAFAGAMRDKEEGVRQIASEGLAKRGAAAVPYLTKLLKDKNKEARKATAETIDKMGVQASGTLGALEEAVKAEKDADVKGAMEQALKKLKTK
jgi:HEAT repeat protein